MASSLLACDWGRTIWTAADTAVCHAQAVQRVALHEGAVARLVQLCDPHRAVVMAETDPHKPT